MYEYHNHRAIKDYPNMNIRSLLNLANWYYGPAEPLDPPVCGNSSGAG